MLLVLGGNIMDDLDLRIKLKVKEANQLAEEFAEAYYNRLMHNMETNKFGFKLADSTLQSRKSAGIKGTIPLIATRAYIEAIVKRKFSVTVRKGKHEPSGLTYLELAYILEYGRKDKHIPAFPVWRKTYEEVQAEFKKLIAKKFKK